MVTENWRADSERLIPHYKGMTSPHLSSQIDSFGQILQDKSCTLPQFEKLFEEPLFLEGLEPKNLKKTAKLPPEGSLHYPGLISQLHSTCVPLFQAARDPRKIVARLAQDLRSELAPLLEKEELFSPDVLLLKMQQALNSFAFVEKMQCKYKAVIVDEFQDTDPIQWEIIQRLFSYTPLVKNLEFGPRPIASICLVGDPETVDLCVP